MLKTLTLSTVAALAFLAAGSASAFNINDDIEKCAEAIADAELLGDVEYNLNFVDDQGNRNRVLTLEAKVVGGDNVTIECRMNRSKIKEVVIVEAE